MQMMIATMAQMKDREEENPYYFFFRRGSHSNAVARKCASSRSLTPRG